MPRDITPVLAPIPLKFVHLLMRSLVILLLFISDVKHAFSMFDKHGVGIVSNKQLINLLRALGQNPTEEEVLDLIIECDCDGNRNIYLIEHSKIVLTHCCSLRKKHY